MAMPSLLVSTRKGLFELQHLVDGWAVTAQHFAGDVVSQTLTDARTGAWYAALRLGHWGVKLHRSDDCGGSWRELPTPAFPTKPTEGPWADDTTPWSVEMLWGLAAGSAEQPGRLWAACMPAGIFRSDDAGQSWHLCESFWHDARRKVWVGGGNDHPAAHTLLVNPRNADHITVAISCGGVWDSHDAGASWQLQGRGLEALYVPEGVENDPNAQDPHRISRCAAHPEVVWLQLHGGIYRSTDHGHNFTRLKPPEEAGVSVGDFGFPVLADPVNPLRAWFVPAQADSHRYAPGARMCMTRTDDGGHTWQVFRSGLPQQHAYDLVYRHGLAIAADRQTMAMASTTGNLWISSNAGAHWELVSSHLPPVGAVAFVDE
jgi:photosystem II stability/assembly factor-like uncharacterized protein